MDTRRKALAAVSGFAVRLGVVEHLWWQVANAAPAVLITDLPLPRPNAFDRYVKAANTLVHQPLWLS